MLTRCAQLPNDIADLDRVPCQDCVRQQTQTARLIHNLLVVAGARLAAIGEEQPAGRFMPRFASTELQLHPSSNLLLVDVTQYEDRLDDPAERRQRFSDSIRWRGAAQALEHYVGGLGIAKGSRFNLKLYQKMFYVSRQISINP